VEFDAGVPTLGLQNVFFAAVDADNIKAQMLQKGRKTSDATADIRGRAHSKFLTEIRQYWAHGCLSRFDYQKGV
jgi:hypothetical protein